MEVVVEEILKQIALVEEEIKSLEKGYADECVELYKQKGFDLYKPKWAKKIEKVAGKYADLIIPLKDKYNELRKQANRLEEEERKKKYKDTY